jgi:nitrate reductase gamma subunit
MPCYSASIRISPVFHAIGISASAKQLLAIVAGGIFGITCFIGLTHPIRPYQVVRQR